MVHVSFDRKYDATRNMTDITQNRCCRFPLRMHAPVKSQRWISSRSKNALKRDGYAETRY
jgi:hypothetical protein